MVMDAARAVRPTVDTRRITTAQTDFPLYPGTLYLAVGPDVPTAFNHLNSTCLNNRFKDVPTGQQPAADTTRKKGEYVITIERGYLSHNTIAHEVVHLVNAVFRRVGIDPDRKNDEADAYFTGWVTEWVYRSLSEQGETVLMEDDY